MDELIVIDQDKMVDARELHRFLGVETRWNTWIMRRIAEFKLVQGVDFIALKNEHNDYNEFRLTMDTAKHLCMVEKNDRGQQARTYFIEAEKKWQERRKGMTRCEQLLEYAQQAVEQERKILDLVGRTDVVEHRLDMLSPDTGYCTVRGMAITLRQKISLDQANLVGRKAASVCKAMGITVGKVGDERHGTVNSYPIEILKPILQNWSEHGLR